MHSSDYNENFDYKESWYLIKILQGPRVLEKETWKIYIAMLM